MTADMVPVGVSNEYGCHRRQSWRKGLQRFVCTFCEVRSRTRINADELLPVLGNNEIVLREFKTGEGVDATRNDFGNAPWCKRMAGGSLLRKWRCQGDWVIEVGIAATPEVVLGLCRIAILQREFAEMKINF